MTTIKSLVEDVEAEARARGIPFDAEAKRALRAALKKDVEVMASRLGIRPASVMPAYGHLFERAILQKAVGITE